MKECFRKSEKRLVPQKNQHLRESATLLTLRQTLYFRLLKHALSSTLSILIPGKTNKGLTVGGVCRSFQTSLENTTLKNSGVGSKRLIKPSLSRPENGQSRAKCHFARVPFLITFFDALEHRSSIPQ